LAALILSLQNLVDPMMRFDDYPALLTDPTYSWPKILFEGR